MELTVREWAFIQAHFAELAKAHGEDMIGVLMKEGAFLILRREQGELIALADKLEDGNFEYLKRWAPKPT